MLEGLRLQESIATLNGSNGCFGYPESLTSSGNANGILKHANDRTKSGVISKTNPITSGPVLRFNMSSPPQVMSSCALKARRMLQLLIIRLLIVLPQVRFVGILLQKSINCMINIIRYGAVIW